MVPIVGNACYTIIFKPQKLEGPLPNFHCVVPINLLTNNSA